MNEKLQLTDKIKDFFHINTTWLPFKLHFFFAYGGYAGVLPFLPIIAKQLGINAAAVGVTFSILPIFVFLSNPIFGLLVDYFQNVKIFLIVLLITSAGAYSSILSIPSITDADKNVAHVEVYKYNGSEYFNNISLSFERSCLEDSLKGGNVCKNMHTTAFNDTGGSTYLLSSMNSSYTAWDFTGYELTDIYWTFFYTKDIPFSENEDSNTSAQYFRCLPDINQCSVNADDHAPVFSTYQYWTFFIFTIMGGITCASVMTLSSVACYEVLGTKMEYYGRQRLFGTISWGLVCPLAGIINDNIVSTEKGFVAGFFVMAVMMIIDIIILCIIYIPKARISNSLSKDLRKMFKSREILVFSLGVALVGAFQNIIHTYEFWFLQDIGASKTLLGMAVAMQCLLGEIPFLFFSGWFVKKLGHFLCFTFVYAGFAIRLFLYSALKDPWFVLPVDVLHGVTFGLYHGAMVSFAKDKSPKGTEATLLGLFSGLADGLGCGIGNFLGGIGLDKLGPRWTFFTASMISIGSLLFFMVSSYAFRESKKEKMLHMPPQEMEETIPNE